MCDSRRVVHEYSTGFPVKLGILHPQRLKEQPAACLCATLSLQINIVFMVVVVLNDQMG